MKHDLRECKVGDWIWTVKEGWEKITDRTGDGNDYPIKTKLTCYDLDGYSLKSDAAPSAFTEPPKCLNAGPKPYDFKKGDRVLVWDSKVVCENNPVKRYFSHKQDGKFYCFINGSTEWSSKGKTTEWRFCKAAPEEEE